MAKSGVSQAGKAGTKAAALTRASGVSNAGSALLASSGKPANRGAGAAGSALLGARGGGGRGAGPGAAATVGAAPAASPDVPPTVQPFLTPDQQKALDSWNASYGDQLGKLTQADSDAQAKWTSDTGAENLKFAQNNDTTNASLAARGLFQSSIRQNALSDLAVTHAAAINTINTNRDTVINNDQITRTTLGGENTATQDYYGGIAVNNAQGVAPVTGDNAGVAATPAPATAAPAAPHPAAAGTAVATAAPALEHPAGAQPHNTGLAATGSALAMHGAALQRVQQPAAVKPPGKVTLNLGPWTGAGGKVGAPS